MLSNKLALGFLLLICACSGSSGDPQGTGGTAGAGGSSATGGTATTSCNDGNDCGSGCCQAGACVDRLFGGTCPCAAASDCPTDAPCCLTQGVVNAHCIATDDFGSLCARCPAGATPSEGGAGGICYCSSECPTGTSCSQGLCE